MEVQLPMNVSSTIFPAFLLPSQCSLAISQIDCLSPMWASASSFQGTQTKTTVLLTMSNDDQRVLSYGKGRFWRWQNTMLEPSLWWHLREKLTLKKGKVSSLPAAFMPEYSAEGLSGLHPTKSMFLKAIWKRGRIAPPPLEPEKELACLLFSPGPLWSDNWSSKWGLFIQIQIYKEGFL